MLNREELKYLKQHEIDYPKWDRCVEEAPNSRVYAVSWYLDRTAVEWDALVWGNYEFVMPLPRRRKLGISYLYQPLYCQQLGIFPNPPAEIAIEFYNAVTHKFSYFDIQNNAENIPPKRLKGVHILPRKNFLLHLETDYEAILSGYSKNTHRNIAKANNNRLGFVENIRLEDYLHLKQKNLPAQFPKSGFQKLKSIIAYSQYKGLGEIEGVYSPGNNLCAAVFFLRWKDRLLYLNAASSEEGKELRAMFFLIDHFLGTTAGKNLTLDFEGSMLPGVARFFEGFGATPETYYQIRGNRLPAPLKWLKRNSE